MTLDRQTSTINHENKISQNYENKNHYKLSCLSLLSYGAKAQVLLNRMLKKPCI